MPFYVMYATIFSRTLVVFPGSIFGIGCDPEICIINKRRDATKDFSCCFQNKNNVIDELRKGSRLSVASV